MPTLKASEIEAALESLDLIAIWLRDLDRSGAHNHCLTDPARREVAMIKTRLLRASLRDVEIEVVPARETEAV